MSIHDAARSAISAGQVLRDLAAPGPSTVSDLMGLIGYIQSSYEQSRDFGAALVDPVSPGVDPETGAPLPSAHEQTIMAVAAILGDHAPADVPLAFGAADLAARAVEAAYAEHVEARPAYVAKVMARTTGRHDFRAQLDEVDWIEVKALLPELHAALVAAVGEDWR